MTARTLGLAAALVLGITGLAQAEAQSTWRDPDRTRGANAPAARAVEAPAEPRAAVPVRQEAQAAPQAAVPVRQVAQAEPPAAARAERQRVRAERRPPGYRSARYRGGNGATWKTGHDAYGFMGSYGGCRYRGHAGPGGYRLDRSC